MDSFEKITLILMLGGLIGILVTSKPANMETRLIPRKRLGTSELPDDCKAGPSYLLSALPSHRRRDDYADPVSVGVYDFSGDQNLPFGETSTS